MDMVTKQQNKTNKKTQLQRDVLSAARQKGEIWLSEEDAVEYTTLCRDVLREAREAGKLTYRMYGKKYLYTVKYLDNFLEHNSTEYRSVDDHIASQKKSYRKK